MLHMPSKAFSNCNTGQWYTVRATLNVVVASLHVYEEHNRFACVTIDSRTISMLHTYVVMKFFLFCFYCNTIVAF